jgi:hypothetical protein
MRDALLEGRRMSGRSRAGMGVSTTPGAIATTRICLPARSRAATRMTP